MSRVAIGEKYPIELAAPMTEDNLIVNEKSIQECIQKETDRNKGNFYIKMNPFFYSLKHEKLTLNR